MRARLQLFSVEPVWLQHAIIAREMKANKLITFDRGFDVLSKNNFFPTVIFDIR